MWQTKWNQIYLMSSLTFLCSFPGAFDLAHLLRPTIHVCLSTNTVKKTVYMHYNPKFSNLRSQSLLFVVPSHFCEIEIFEVIFWRLGQHAIYVGFYNTGQSRESVGAAAKFTLQAVTEEAGLGTGCLGCTVLGRLGTGCPRKGSSVGRSCKVGWVAHCASTMLSNAQYWGGWLYLDGVLV